MFANFRIHRHKKIYRVFVEQRKKLYVLYKQSQSIRGQKSSFKFNGLLIFCSASIKVDL